MKKIIINEIQYDLIKGLLVEDTVKDGFSKIDKGDLIVMRFNKPIVPNGRLDFEVVQSTNGQVYMKGISKPVSNSYYFFAGTDTYIDVDSDAISLMSFNSKDLSDDEVKNMLSSSVTSWGKSKFNDVDVIFIHDSNKQLKSSIYLDEELKRKKEEEEKRKEKEEERKKEEERIKKDEEERLKKEKEEEESKDDEVVDIKAIRQKVLDDNVLRNAFSAKRSLWDVLRGDVNPKGLLQLQKILGNYYDKYSDRQFVEAFDGRGKYGFEVIKPFNELGLDIKVGEWVDTSFFKKSLSYGVALKGENNDVDFTLVLDKYLGDDENDEDLAIYKAFIRVGGDKEELKVKVNKKGKY